MLPLIGAGLALGGGVLGALGSYRQGQYAQAEANFNASQLRIDAQIAQQNAFDQARQLREQGRFLQGAQRTRTAISGVRMEGTPLEIMAETAAKVQRDQVKIQAEGVWQAQNLRTQAKFTQQQGAAAAQAGTIGAFAGLLSGGAGASMFMMK